jgi:nickel superoxide dismutase
MRSRSLFFALVCSACFWAHAGAARAHCQVPCGIYDDAARVAALREDFATIAKAMAQIVALAPKADALSKNQLARWVLTKEQHAERVMRTIADYFMAQLIKPASGPTYLETLARHHAVLVAAMKCKQSVSPADAQALAKAIDGIAGYWKR